MYPAAIQRPGPRVPVPAELADLLVPPACHDRLARAVPRGMVVIPPLGGGFRIIPRPACAIHRESQRPAGRPVSGQQVPQPPRIDTAIRQRGVRTAMPAAQHRLQRQPRETGHRPASDQHRVGEPEQRIRLRPQAPVPPAAEPSQPAPGCPLLRGRRPPRHTEDHSHRLFPVTAGFEDEAVAALMPARHTISSQQPGARVKTKAKEAS
jgi:hypothetical protein